MDDLILELVGDISNNHSLSGELSTKPSLTGDISQSKSLSGKISNNDSLSGIISTVYTATAPPYQGEYEVTPGEEEQVIKTQYQVLDKNIIVKPIPSNYGRIVYDGSILTIF